MQPRRRYSRHHEQPFTEVHLDETQEALRELVTRSYFGAHPNCEPTRAFELYSTRLNQTAQSQYTQEAGELLRTLLFGESKSPLLPPATCCDGIGLPFVPDNAFGQVRPYINVIGVSCPPSALYPCFRPPDFAHARRGNERRCNFAT